MDHPLAKTLRAAIESDGDAKVADLHLWRVGRAQFAAVVCIVADAPLDGHLQRMIGGLVDELPVADPAEIVGALASLAQVVEDLLGDLGVPRFDRAGCAQG